LIGFAISNKKEQLQTSCSFLFFEERFNEKLSIAAVGLSKIPYKTGLFCGTTNAFEFSWQFPGEFSLVQSYKELSSPFFVIAGSERSN